MNRNRLANSEWEQVRTAHASGIGLREIARSMGIPAGTVLARAKREGWTRRREHAKTLAVAPAAHPARTPSEAAAVSMAERGQRHLARMAGVVERTLPAVEAMAPEGILDRIEDIDRLDKVARRTFGIADNGDRGSAVLISIALRGIEMDAAPLATVEA